MAPDRTVV
jgi:hypothetical protein